jgi:hypothetical protein
MLRLEHGHKRLLGESIREIGVLLLVFVPLDGYLRISNPAERIQSRYLQWLNVIGRNNVEIIFFALFGIVLLALGIKVERDAELAEHAMKEGA